MFLIKKERGDVQEGELDSEVHRREDEVAVEQNPQQQQRFQL